MLKNKFITGFLTLFLLGNLNAQEKNHETGVYVKGNALLIPVGVVNVGVEHQLSKKYTLQADILISPWKSFSERHFQIYMGHVEGRYYFEEAFKHWYVGVNAGAGIFDLTKPTYKGEDKKSFQRGFNLMLGATVGYQFLLNDRWNIDVYLGGGTSQAFYHGYKFSPESGKYERYGSENWDKSGELIPYRGGVMISYKLK